jgi:hypothetical protein
MSTTIGTERTYEPVKLRFGHYREVFQRDRYSGESVYGDKATETHILLDVDINIRVLEQGVEVEGIIEGKDFDKDKLAAKVRAALVAGLPKRCVYDLYRLHEIRVRKDDPELPEAEAESTVDDLVAPEFEEQARAGNQAIADLELAIEDITDGLKFDERRRVQNGLMFLESFHQANNCGHMFAWCQEKLSGIRRGISDLGTRKNTSHPNYVRTYENVTGWVRSWPKYNRWAQQPPKRRTV